MTEKKENGIRQRCLFVAMLSVLLNEGGEDALLQGRTPAERKQMAEAWNANQYTPVGVILNRPDFENVKVNNDGKNNTQRFKKHGDRRDKGVSFA